MTSITYREAVARGIAQEMRRDDRVVFLGEDVAAAGGVFKATVGLLEEFGPRRVRDTPISEQAILGAAMGAAMTGLRPVAEIMFSDFFAVCWDLVADRLVPDVDGALVHRLAHPWHHHFGAHCQFLQVQPPSSHMFVKASARSGSGPAFASSVARSTAALASASIWSRTSSSTPREMSTPR